ncbi:hypothetical protein RB195_026509 [Necator americanus]|uniref:Uncharacterized protein n=1 Tax=Necator americanus TaxID=51031 RepID=A0ABR1EXD2_NECAM
MESCHVPAPDARVEANKHYSQDTTHTFLYFIDVVVMDKTTVRFYTNNKKSKLALGITSFTKIFYSFRTNIWKVNERKPSAARYLQIIKVDNRDRVDNRVFDTTFLHVCSEKKRSDVWK